MTIRISTAALAVCCAFPFSSLAASMGDTVVVTATRSARTVDGSLSAVSDVLARMRLTHTRPAYGIDQVEVAGRMAPVV